MRLSLMRQAKVRSSKIKYVRAHGNEIMLCYESKGR